MDVVPVSRLRPALSRRALRVVDDERLLAQVRAGSCSAFEVVYNRYHAGILSFCRHMLGSREEAEDVVQQTFAAAYTSLLADGREIALKPWLYAIARNGCLSLLRGRREHVALQDAETRLPATAGLSVQVEQREDLRALLGDLQRLPEDQRAALILAELDVQSHEEIALVLGVPAMKVRALVFQAREALISRRLAREVDCRPIREQLAVLRGGARRRRELRHHVAQCAGCRAFEAEVRRQRAGMAVLLPVAPTLALKDGSLAVAFAAAASGAAAGGGATAGGVAAGGVAAGGVAAGGVAAGGVAAGGTVGGSTAVGGAASIGAGAILAGGAKALGMKVLIGMALTGVAGGGYTAVRQLPDEKSAAPVHATSGAPNQPQKAALKQPRNASADPTSASSGSGDRDGDGIPNGKNRDRDGDGIPNRNDGCPNKAGAANDGCANNTPAERTPAGSGSGDRDGDGVANRKDRDRDGDGIPNGKNRDRDGDGIPKGKDRDRDGDGIPNGKNRDRDGDGIPKGKDRDRANDRVPNRKNTCLNEASTACAKAGPDKGTPSDAKPSDRDGDGIRNRKDGDPDGDGIRNRNDSDPDGDGIRNRNDSDPEDDGIRNRNDSDRDGDAVPNRKDGCPNQASTTCAKAAPGDATPAAPKPGDRDGDGVPNRNDKCSSKHRTPDECAKETPDAPTPAVPAPVAP